MVFDLVNKSDAKTNLALKDHLNIRQLRKAR